MLNSLGGWYAVMSPLQEEKKCGVRRLLPPARKGTGLSCYSKHFPLDNPTTLLYTHKKPSVNYCLSHCHTNDYIHVFMLIITPSV